MLLSSFEIDKLVHAMPRRSTEEQFPYSILSNKNFDHHDIWLQSSRIHRNDLAPESERVYLCPADDGPYWTPLVDATLLLMEKHLGGHADRFDPFPITLIFQRDPPSLTRTSGVAYINGSGWSGEGEGAIPTLGVQFEFANATPQVFMALGTSKKIPLTVSTPFNWAAIDEVQFERLVFSLYEDDESFEKVEWLQHTNSPDSGRDISAVRVESGSRVLIQARHKVSTIAEMEVNECVTKAETWDPPFDEVIVSTSSTFRQNAVRWMEQNNKKKVRPTVGFEPNNRLEVKLSRRSHLITHLGLR